MKRKQVLSILLLTGLIFMSGMGLLPVYAADEWQNVYEAYGINPNDPQAEYLVGEMLWEKPPQAIVIKLEHYAAPTGTLSVPLNKEVAVELGKSANISTSFEWDDGTYRLAYDVDLTVRYERDKDHETAAMLLWDSKTYIKGSRYGATYGEPQQRWIEVAGDTYIREAGKGSYIVNGSSSLLLNPKSRSEESHENLPINLGGITYKIDRVMVKSGGLSSVIDTDASGTAGDTSASVAATIVIGLLGLAAAAAGAGAAGATAGSSGDKASNDEEAAAYEMVIGKDFGNALKYGQKQRVWARMVELKNGVPVDRPDLLAEISIFSNEVIVGALSLRGNNVEAEVQIQENAPPEGVISFLYSGEHGTFQNNVRFRLLGKGEIRLASDKVNILSTDANPFELVYELKNFIEEEPPLEITASSGFVALDMGKNDKQQTVILIAPGPDAEPWDHKSFTKPCKCEITAMDGKFPVKAAFEVNVCFEGIGTAYEKLAADELEKDALIQCFTEAEKEKRTEKALWIPIAVMNWNEKNRILEPDSAKADNLTWTYAVHPDFEFKTPESKRLAERVVTKAKLKAERHPAPATLKIDTTKKPSAYRVMAEADPDEGAALFDLRMTVVWEGDATLAPLELTAQIQPNPDFKGMVRWFLEYPLGSAAADFITLGDVSIYHAALDFIESRVYPMSGVPWSSNLLWNRESDSHYEHGRWDIMRESYIAIKDDSFPKGIDANEFKKVQTLVHELAHVIEDQHGSYKVNATSETHTYYLQHLSDVARGLADLESDSSNLKTDVWYAINWAYWFNVDPEIIGDISNIGPWFGGRFTLSMHELFDKYAYHADTLGGKMSDARRQEVAQQFRHWYFPGNLSDSAMQKGSTAAATGRFIESDGLFKGAEWTFVWNQGVLQSIELAHDDYLITIEDYHWTGGNELKLNLQIRIADKNLPSYDYDSLSVTLDGGTFNTATRSFPSVRSFSVAWKSLNDFQHSLIYKKTGFSEIASWTERKK